jgi:DNA-binding MurR/RpiR family transcriptional regulator
MALAPLAARTGLYPAMTIKKTHNTHAAPAANVGCLASLRSLLPNLTKAERKTAEYILANSSDVVHMTIIGLAEAVQVAETTIFRLCKKLRLSGFQAFKIALAGESFPAMEFVFNDVVAEDTPSQIADKIFQRIGEGLQDTLAIINEESLAAAVDALCAAGRLYAYGSGGSAIVAMDIEHRFMRFGIPVFAYADPHMQYSSASLLTGGDVVIAVSHTGASHNILEAAALSRKSGAVVIAITSYLRSPVSRIADVTLCGLAREIRYRNEAMSSRLMHLAIVDILYVATMMRLQDRITANMKKIRRAIAKLKT